MSHLAMSWPTEHGPARLEALDFESAQIDSKTLVLFQISGVSGSFPDSTCDGPIHGPQDSCVEYDPVKRLDRRQAAAIGLTG